jgi:hypothetical protein
MRRICPRTPAHLARLERYGIISTPVSPLRLMSIRASAQGVSMNDIIRNTPYAFSWLSTKQVCQRWDAYYAAINWENHNAPPYNNL